MATLNDEIYFASADGLSNWGEEDGLTSIYNRTSFLEGATDTHFFFTGQLEDGSYSLFSHDGSDADPVALTVGSPFPTANGSVVGDAFYFVPTTSQELWQSDGTVVGTNRLQEIQHLSSVFGETEDQLLLGIDRPIGFIPVSYTHLTLPTIYSV